MSQVAEYEYMHINLSLEPSPRPLPRTATIEEVANRYAAQGWRVVSVMPAQGSGHATSMLLERRKSSNTGRWDAFFGRATPK